MNNRPQTCICIKPNIFYLTRSSVLLKDDFAILPSKQESHTSYDSDQMSPAIFPLKFGYIIFCLYD